MDVFFDHLRAKWHWFGGNVAFTQALLCFLLLSLFCFAVLLFCDRKTLFLSQNGKKLPISYRKLVYTGLFSLGMGLSLTGIAAFTLLGRNPTAVNTAASAFSSFTILFNGNTEILYDQFFNMLLFVPLGIITGIKYPIRISAPFTIGVSITVELIQLVTHRGLLELSDMVMNSLGSLIGIGFGGVIIRIIQTQKKRIIERTVRLSEERLSERNELLSIIASQLNKTALQIHIADWQKLIRHAKRHGLLQFIALYVEDLPEDMLPDEQIQEYLFSVLMQETTRSANQLDAVAEMQEAMENNGIFNLAVKGSVTKLRYGNELLRTMGDIDLLYKPEQHHVFKTLMFSLGYGDYREGRKNDTYSRPPFLTVEAHREMVSSESDYADYYRNIWQIAQPKDGMKYTYEMRVEDELVFNIVHLAVHFKEGGAGIRFIIDVYVYSRIEMDKDYVEQELKKLGLNEFYHHILDLAEYWFADGESSELTEKLADFIMDGGVFGEKENATALAVEEGRVKHFFRVSFPDYDSMKSMFPWLEGKGVLLPYAWGLRGVRAIRSRRDNIFRQMECLRTGDTKRGKALKQFYTECGL